MYWGYITTLLQSLHPSSINQPRYQDKGICLSVQAPWLRTFLRQRFHCRAEYKVVIVVWWLSELPAISSASLASRASSGAKRKNFVLAFGFKVIPSKPPDTFIAWLKCSAPIARNGRGFLQPNYRVYITQTSSSKVSQIRWWMFKTKQIELEKLGPTSAALKQAILHAHYQGIVWYNDIIDHP